MSTTQRYEVCKKFAFLFALVSLSLCFVQGWQRSSAGMDLVQYLVPARVWLEGGNPYNVEQYRADFVRITHSNPQIAGSCPYLPHTFLLLAPIAALPFPLAYHLWWVLSFCALLVSFACLRKLIGRTWSSLEFALFVALLAQSRLIQSVAYRGQFSLVALALMLLVIANLPSKRGVASGFLIALACIKYTLAFPTLLYLLWKKEWKPILWTVIFLGVGNLIAAGSIGFGEVGRNFPRSFAVFLSQNQSEANWHIMNWMGIYATLFGTGALFARILNALSLLAAGAALVRVYRIQGSEDREWWGLASLTMFNLIAIYHRVYDGVFVFVVAAVAWNAFRRPDQRFRLSLWLMGSVLILFLFVVSPQNVTERLANLLVSMTGIPVLVVVNAWLSLALFVFTIYQSLHVPLAVTEPIPRQEVSSASPTSVEMQ